MSFSREWTEWHLTPRGWESGSERIDGPGITEKPAPSDRVLTVRWLEEQTSPYSKMHRGTEEKWRGDDKEAIAKLLEQYGKAPESL